ncbi:thiol oxidoreductase-like protein [bacterium]|nr:thiol oxidoreductase-like protein [bacterium]
MRKRSQILRVLPWAAPFLLLTATAIAQLVDKTMAPNAANEGINKSYVQEIGAGRGDIMTPDSSAFIIGRDPFRAIRRGRQLFQRKFNRAQGNGPLVGDGMGDVGSDLRIGAGLADSCASCHGRPRGSAGFGGDVATRPDSRDSAHLFGLGLKEMLADEITYDLRDIRTQAINEAQTKGKSVTKALISKNIHYGLITANPDGSLDTTKVEGVNADLRIRPFFAEGKTISIREFVAGALQAEMGLQAVDPDLANAANNHQIITTPSGMVLDGASDQIEAPPTSDPNADPDNDGVVNEVPEAIVDYLEFYLMNYFKPGLLKQTHTVDRGRKVFEAIGCANCHIPDLMINHDRRVADVNTEYDSVNGVFNRLFATAQTLNDTVDDGSGFPALKPPHGGSFLVKDIYTDFKRHDLGPNFYERNYDGSTQQKFMTRPLWGVGSSSPYGHDGRSINLAEVILRHDGEAKTARDNFKSLSRNQRAAILEFLESLVLFPPDDTASNLNPADPTVPGFPQFGHGSIKLSILFNDPSDLE